MSRPKKSLSPIDEALVASADKPAQPEVFASHKTQKILCKAFHMVVGVDLVGSKTSMAASRNLSLEVTPLGIKCVSEKSARTILIPWTNIKGAELY